MGNLIIRVKYNSKTNYFEDTEFAAIERIE